MYVYGMDKTQNHFNITAFFSLVIITLFYEFKHNAMGEWRYGSVFLNMALDEGM